ncbi:46 kDa FK506-binding nuclear protein-like isoform X2 [Cloeon dipterum]|uniref:46 kDa FK506-binding nuclear protein-like isoform X2 n=1 Tax=Cloeon dipterum TaxID=197152 RepID=UPI00322034B7
MFWGLALESGKKYAQKVARAFHISMAALDLRVATDEEVSVIMIVDNREFVLCSLTRKNHILQQPLDLNFIEGEDIALSLRGKGAVNLTGYIIPEDYVIPKQFQDSEEEEEEEAPPLISIADKKRKVEGSLGNSNKKLKTLKAISISNCDDDDDDNADDETESEDDMMNTQAEDSDEDDSEEDPNGEEEEDSDEDENEESDNDEMESDGDDSEESEVQVPQPSKKQLKLQQKNNQAQKQLKSPKAPEQKTPNKAQERKTPNKAQEQKTPNKATNGAATPKEQQSGKKGEKQTPKQTPKATTEEKKAVTPGTKKSLTGGVIIEDLVIGNGPVASAGKNVAVYYIGRNKQTNKVFDSTQSGPAFKFRIGKGDVIKGWDIGVPGMRVGGKRRIICPPHTAYGNRGSPPAIPPHSTLVFDIELKNVS